MKTSPKMQQVVQQLAEKYGMNLDRQSELADFTETWAVNLLDQKWLDRGVKYEPSIEEEIDDVPF